MAAVVRQASASKVLTMAAREIREFIRDGRFVASAAMILLLLGAALVGSAAQVRDLRRERAAAERTSYEQWLGQGTRNAHSATHYGIYAFKPASPLAFVDPGVDRFTGTTVFLESHKRNELVLRPARDTADVARFADLSAAMLLQVVVPLWILLLAHASVTGDRDSGVLRFVASFSVTPWQIGRAKALGVTAAAGLLLVPAAATGSATLVLAGAHDADAGVGPRAAVLAMVYLIYYGIVLALGLTVSARVRSARVALLALVGVWIAACVIVPRTGADVARLLHPLPSALEFKHGVNRRLLEAEHDRNARLRDQVLRTHGVDRVEALPFNFEGLNLQDSEDLGNRVFDEAYARLAAALDAQDRIHLHAGWLTPVQAVRALSMALAGTDSLHHRRFADAAEHYRRDMVRAMNMAVMQNAGTVNAGYIGTQTLNRMVDREVWAMVPPFSYTPLSLSGVLRASLYPFVILAAWALGLLVMAARSMHTLEHGTA